jgi:hypothetical protein
MKTDGLNRRSRFAKPQPLDTRIVLTDADYALFKVLDRHGQLPVPYLDTLTKDRHLHRLQHRLTQLYNGVCDHADHASNNKDGHVCKPKTYVSRNPEQWNNFHARYQPAVYSLTSLGRSHLDKPEPFIRRSGQFVHDLFSGCLSASFDVQAPPNTFLARRDIIEHPKCPAATKALHNPFELPVSMDTIIPDDVFGLSYEDGGYRFFALEADRASERVDTQIAASSSIAKKVRHYRYIMENKVQTKHLGILTLTVLFATTAEARARNIVEHIKENVPPAYHSRFLVKSFSGFSKDTWRVPRELLPVYEPWMSAAGDVTLNKKASA